MATTPQAEQSCFTSTDKPTWELYSTCVHCGLCLQHCPTYRVLGTEMDSPRGRIYQVLLADEGRLPVAESFATHIDRCLGCLACETACPSGVQYGHIVERARTQIEQQYRRGWLERRLREFAYGGLLTDYKRLSRWARRLRWYQRSKLSGLVRKSGLLRLLGVAEIEKLAPEISEDFTFHSFKLLYPAEGERRGRVALLAGCVGSIAFDELNQATIRVLQKNGFEVMLPAAQTCCGALSAHAGRREEARALARRNIKAFLKDGEFDAILTNSAGCGSMMKDYGDLLREDGDQQAIKDFVAKVRDVTEFLVGVGPRTPKRQLEGKATYQDPCHLAHAQKIRSAPRELLKQVGVKLVEMEHPDFCCGSAGSYNVTQNELSMQILDAKMNDVAATEAPIVITANTGCMLQLRAGAARRGLKLEVKHVLEVLDAAY